MTHFYGLSGEFHIILQEYFTNIYSLDLLAAEGTFNDKIYVKSNC